MWLLGVEEGDRTDSRLICVIRTASTDARVVMTRLHMYDIVSVDRFWSIINHKYIYLTNPRIEYGQITALLLFDTRTSTDLLSRAEGKGEKKFLKGKPPLVVKIICEIVIYIKKKSLLRGSNPAYLLPNFLSSLPHINSNQPDNSPYDIDYSFVSADRSTPLSYSIRQPYGSNTYTRE